MKKVFFSDFRLHVLNHIKAITHDDIEPYSTEWFLLKYLKRITKAADGYVEYTYVEGPIRSLIRFYVDNIDENSELGERCRNVHDEYRKVLLEKQSEKNY
ncbi:MAG: hypothetical protein RLT87_07265 [Gammaproteobacteria bacterium]